MSLAMTVAPDSVVLVPSSLTVPQTLIGVGVGAVTVTWVLPVTLWNAARMSTSPGATAVTKPVEETVAMLVLDDCQVAWFVTVCVLLFDITAVAVNCEESPGLADEAGAVTAIELTVGAAGVVGVVAVPFPAPPQLTRPKAMPTETNIARRVRPTEPPFGNEQSHTVRAGNVNDVRRVRNNPR